MSVAPNSLCTPKIQLGFDFYGSKQYCQFRTSNTKYEQIFLTPILYNFAAYYGGYCTKVVNIFAVGTFSLTKLFSQKPVSAVATGVSSMAVAYLTFYNGFKDFDL